MPRLLFLDATRGVSAASVLAALVDLGVAPSPVLHAVAGLDLPVDLRIDMCARGPTVHATGARSVRFEPRAPDRLLAPLPAPARHLAADALQRLALARVPPGEACPLALEVDAGAVAALAGAAVAHAALGADAVRVSRVAVPPEPDEALLDLLGPFAGALEFDEAGRATTLDGAALLRALATEGDAWGAPEPAWAGPVARGESCEEPAVRAALGLGSARGGAQPSMTP